MSSRLILNNIDKALFRTDLPSINVGEKIELTIKRDPLLEKTVLVKGIVIAKKNPNRLSYSFTVTKEINKIVVTTTFFYHLSPIIKIKKEGKIRIRRAKLYYLERNLIRKTN